ncbi:MAG TPA: FHA domain-containing protein [Pyrinomonadaceae bacterium]
MRVTLNVYGPTDTRQITLEEGALTIGRTDDSSVVLKDDGLSRVHASFHREGVRVWVADEGSTNGTFVNGEPVPITGTPLVNGDEITVGSETSITVAISEDRTDTPSSRAAEAVANPAEKPSIPIGTSLSTSTKIAAVSAIALVLIAGVALVTRAFMRTPNDHDRPNGNVSELVTPTPIQAIPQASPEGSSPDLQQIPPDQIETTPEVTSNRKLYLQMSPDEQMDFIEKQARHVSIMMGNRPYAFSDDVLRYIKQYVDGYARRVGNNSTRLWGEDLRFMFARAREQYAPSITRAFNNRGVPSVVGLYLVVVETEYHNIRSENVAGAAGLFQFIGPTARGYGVDPSERTNVTKMAPAAAAYMADRIAEFGPDSMSVALAIAGYNRSPDSVRRDLHDVLNSENRERSFWTLVANSNKLDRYFQGENIKYVPKFFAAAVVGENPWAFGIQMQPLSTYTEIKSPPESGTQ